MIASSFSAHEMRLRVQGPPGIEHYVERGWIIMSLIEAVDGTVRLYPANICELIERKRQLSGQDPVDRSVITTRCGIAFTVARKRWLNFKNDQIEVDGEDLDCIAEILEERFNIEVRERELLKLCSPANDSMAVRPDSRLDLLEPDGGSFGSHRHAPRYGTGAHEAPGRRRSLLGWLGGLVGPRRGKRDVH